MNWSAYVTFNFEKIDIPRTTSSLQKIETETQSGHDFVFRIDVDNILSSESSDEFSSFAQNFLSSTDSSEHEVSEKGRVDPQLLQPVADPRARQPRRGAASGAAGTSGAGGGAVGGAR